VIPLQFIVEPERLLLTWQPRDESSSERSRRTVGEVWLDQDRRFRFRYLKDQPDFSFARELGFEGFPAFDLRAAEIDAGVAETLMKRLPPRNREDFPEFLAQHRLPFPFPGSELALLGYTGAKLPSDGFALVPQFPPDSVPCDYITEVAGLRHVFKGDVSAIKPGDPVAFLLDGKNTFDSDAVQVHWHGQQLGYVNRALCKVIRNWLSNAQVHATVERINGRPERPLIYVRINAR
jgi:hypothetical protein